MWARPWHAQPWTTYDAEGTHEVVPLCPFIKAWIEHHSDYQDLVHVAPRSTAKD